MLYFFLSRLNKFDEYKVHVIRFTHLAIALVAMKLVHCCLFWHFLQAVGSQEFPC